MSATIIEAICADARATSHDTHLTYCGYCQLVFCDSCYDKIPSHYAGRAYQLNKHEKTDLDDARFVLDLFGTSPSEDSDRDDRHSANIHSKWFGADIDLEKEKSYFNDFGGFERLMQAERSTPHDQYPSLISFLGTTGAGKSTLINGMLKLPIMTTGNALPDDLITPIMGRSHEQISPTSGDVHIFSDGNTRDTEYPMLYVDCEGMDAGAALPAEASCLEKKLKCEMIRRMIIKKSRQIVISPPVTRSWVVKQLYPRILFPFSDVVCYVTTNARQVGLHLENLLDWAHKAIDKSTNQPILPHAFMIMNTFEVDGEQPKDCFNDWWDINKLTEKILQEHAGIFSNSRVISDLVSYWKPLRKVSTLRDLIYRYYSDFKVICIPNRNSSQPSHIINQYRKLRDAIKDASNSCREVRNKSGSLMSAGTLGRYFDMAFDHFTMNPDKPFNFLSAALHQTPVTQTFKDHICKLAVRYMRRFPSKSGREIFTELAPWVASCIFLDSHRLELPHNDVTKTIIDGYKGFCHTAQSEFFKNHWACEAVDHNNARCVNMESTHESKGHQNTSGTIFVAKDSEYRQSFKSCFKSTEGREDERRAFMAEVKNELEICIASYQNPPYNHSHGHDERKKAAAKLHKTMFGRYISKRVENKDFMVKSLISNRTCFCCLTSSPVYKLFCDHLICRHCLEDYSLKNPQNPNYRVLKECPICGFETGSHLNFEMKPPTAGLRILCLDGGGIRSIMQLEVLKELERIISVDIPIARFFDLIVGTSGGAIVAAGLGLEHKSIDECIALFKKFAKDAFVKRTAIDWPLVGGLIMARHHGRFKTSALEKVLKEAFGEKHIFGDVIPKTSSPTIRSIKVAITATSLDRSSFLLGNYNRPPPDTFGAPKPRDSSSSAERERASDLVIDQADQAGLVTERTRSNADTEDDGEYDNDREIENSLSREYSFSQSSSSTDTLGEFFCAGRGEAKLFRADDPSSEIKIWEALRASTAAPTIFKSFTHQATKLTFDDGALKCNNPVFIADKERKTLWPRLSNGDPDMILSIGTGISNLSSQRESSPKFQPSKGIWNFGRKMFKMSKDTIEEAMDCENMWKEYMVSLGLGDNDGERKDRYRRLNPFFDGIPVPALCDTGELGNLEELVGKYINDRDTKTQLTRIARQLFGSLFFFELQDVMRVPGTDVHSVKGMGHDLRCKGIIACRDYTDKLKTRLEKERNMFLFGENLRDAQALKYDHAATTTTGHKLAYNVEFTIRCPELNKGTKMSMYINIWGEIQRRKPVTISGFPRNLIAEANRRFNRGS